MSKRGDLRAFAQWGALCVFLLSIISGVQGQFFGLHMIAVDSRGNIYTGEVWNGERVQRFVPIS